MHRQELINSVIENATRRRQRPLDPIVVYTRPRPSCYGMRTWLWDGFIGLVGRRWCQSIGGCLVWCL